MRYETSVVINRPIEEVWAFVTDPFNAPRWRSAQLGVRWTPPGPVRLGTTGQVRLVIFGFETRLNAVITEWDSPHALALSGNGAGFRSVSLRLTLEATADGTEVVTVSQSEPRPALKPLYWILGPVLGRRSAAAMQELKRLLESGRG